MGAAVNCTWSLPSFSGRIGVARRLFNRLADFGSGSNYDLDPCGMSALPPITDIVRPHAQVRSVPTGDILYSITSSARDKSVGGTDRPSAFADLTLTTNSKSVGCWIGRSAGRSPFRMRPMYVPACRDAPAILAP